MASKKGLKRHYELLMNNCKWASVGDWEIPSQDEMRRRLNRYRGIKLPLPPKEKSTKLTITDFEVLTGIATYEIWRWLAKTKIKQFGPDRSRRMARALWLADNGYVKKFSARWHGFKILDEPIQPAVREMRVNINLGGGEVKLTQEPKPLAPKTLPSFADLFGKGK